MRRLLFVMWLSLCFLALNSVTVLSYEKEIKSLSSSLAEDIASSNKKSIAVVDFTDLQGNTTELGRFIAEEVSGDITMARKGFEIIDRTHLKTILAEHKLSISGLVDPSNVKKLGKITGVDAIITGYVTPFGDNIRVSAKVITTDTAKIIGAAKEDIAKTEAIEQLLSKGVGTIAETSKESMITSSVKNSEGKSIEAEGFVFNPVKCWRNGNKTICTISFQNTSNEDRRLSFWGGERSYASYLYDNYGSQYPVNIRIGRTESHTQSANFVPKLPMNVDFIAGDVHSEATYMTVVVNASGFKKSVAVRDIPITKGDPNENRIENNRKGRRH